MGKYLDALGSEAREAANLVARHQQEKLAHDYPGTADIALSARSILATAESIAKTVTERGCLEDLLNLAESIRTHKATQ